ncbi:MAG TPA: Amuc_1099 family pilus-like system protein [Chthoniobacteraceae bacterium]|nr:Amuc_1099 family pilus-like system protein [Chthoniobacteraceae bacterium]
MNRSLCRLAALIAALAVAAGCKKKEADTELADEAEKALPATEQAAPGEVAKATAPVGERTAGNADFEAWFKKYGLNLNDPKMLDADPDGDGFTNREEFLADTNPLDPNDYPGIHKKIRLKEFTEVRLPLLVEAVEGEKARIRRTDGDGKLETVKAGDAVRGLPLTVERVEEIHDTDKEGKPIDRSRVVLEDSGTKEKLTLVKDMPARTAASFAMLTSSDGNTTIKVKQGDTFKWPGDDSATYKVIDLREDQVVLQQLENKKMWTVTRAADKPAAAAEAAK